LLAETFTHASDLASYVIVKNYGRGEDFSHFEGSAVEQEALNRGAQIISIKPLQSSTMRKIDRLNFSFWAAANNNSRAGECLGMMERQRVKSWLKNSYQQFERALSVTKGQLPATNNDETAQSSNVGELKVTQPYLVGV
jgi:hypothetical protein